VLTGSNWGTRTELEEVVALALQDRLTLQVERAPLDAINDVLARLEAGQVAGRAVLVP
jgi:alcohol dehydrogenase, propanol-preferring